MIRPKIIMLPGLGGSSPDHWQSLWHKKEDNSEMIDVSDWNAPNLNEWLDAIDNVVTRTEEPFVFVAHSLGCALAAKWVTSSSKNLSRLKGILMVAPADIDDEALAPEKVRHFSPMPMKNLGCKVITVASSTDPYVSPARASEFTSAWNGSIVNIGDKGHINSSSGLGQWDDGRTILDELLR
ncbi:MAG: alpha/beta fold hydrolase [Sneathiellales bacterium]|nr:alpha/beta fold hydrolase [Sneathiellales bacterium]